MEIISVKFPGYSRTGISLHSRKVLVHLDLWHGTRSCIQIYLFCGNTTHSHHCRVWCKQNKEYHANCIQATVKSPVSVQVCEAISSRCISLQRRVNGNKRIAKYQSVIIHDIEIFCECVVFPRRDISLYMIARHVIILKVLEHFKNVKEYLF